MLLMGRVMRGEGGKGVRRRREKGWLKMLGAQDLDKMQWSRWGVLMDNRNVLINKRSVLMMNRKGGLIIEVGFNPTREDRRGVLIGKMDILMN